MTDKKMKKIHTSSITLIYMCNICLDEVSQPLDSIVDIGTAICPECGDDMQLQHYVLMNEEDSVVTSDLCPICGQLVSLLNDETKDGRLVASCGDAFTKEQWGSYVSNF